MTAMAHNEKMGPSLKRRRFATASTVLIGLLLSGCKTFSPNGGMDLVAGVAGGL